MKKKNKLVAEQNKPKKNSSEAIWDLVIQDMKDRDNEGLKRYKTRLQAFNGRNPLIDRIPRIFRLGCLFKTSLSRKRPDD